MKKYIIVKKYHEDYLEEEVNRMLNNGYELIGGVSVSKYSPKSLSDSKLKMVYCQAMTKEVE